MREITVEPPELKTIVINGEVFPVLKADTDILDRAMCLMDEISSLENGDAEGILRAVRSVIGYIDEILGEGATAKIVQDRPFGISYGVGLMKTVCESVISEYNERLSSYDRVFTVD